MEYETKHFVRDLINHLRGYVPNNDYDAIVEIVKKYTDKNIKAKDIYYYWSMDKSVVKKWVIEAFTLAAIDKGWLPSAKEQAEKVATTFIDAEDPNPVRLKKAIGSKLKTAKAESVSVKTCQLLA